MALVMQLAGIPGECEFDGYARWHSVLGFNWGGSRVERSQAARGTRAMAKVWTPQLRNLVVQRKADGRSASLWEQMYTAKEFSEIKFEWLRTGAGKPVSYFSAAFRKARIISIKASSDGSHPIEEITFLYVEVTLGVTNVGNTLSGAQDVFTYTMASHVLE